MIGYFLTWLLLGYRSTARIKLADSTIQACTFQYIVELSMRLNPLAKSVCTFCNWHARLFAKVY